MCPEGVDKNAAFREFLANGGEWARVRVAFARSTETSKEGKKKLFYTKWRVLFVGYGGDLNNRTSEASLKAGRAR